MDSGWQYRIVSVIGAMTLAFAGVAIANDPLIQSGYALLPVVGHLPFDPAVGGEFVIEASVTASVLTVVMSPLFKPRPWRILDIVSQTLRRVSITVLALATIGYFDFTYRLPRATLIVVSGFLFVSIPIWFVLIRRRPQTADERTVIIGDDASTMAAVLRDIENPVIGYIAPPLVDTAPPDHTAQSLTRRADGGVPRELSSLPSLGGLSRVDDTLVEYDVGTAVLAFSQSDRKEFFGALDACYEHGVAAKVHRGHADAVLTDGDIDSMLVDIDLEPWDWQDYILKRTFDILFAATGLCVLSPVCVMIALAIKLDSPGPVLYHQARTAAFGDTFHVAKFRTMIPDAEADTGAQLSAEDADEVDTRVTRVGRILRATHLDEIPQLWAILTGEMSVVGPRPERPELDQSMEKDADFWRRRWFVKPGLTGLAQINEITGFDPDKKLRYDITYIRRQSFWFDLKIITRQLWMVGTDVIRILW
jgi:lipopolysaccharide/colanic/teichoic acid biosynthesis glycosyltransferase